MLHPEDASVGGVRDQRVLETSQADGECSVLSGRHAHGRHLIRVRIIQFAFGLAFEFALAASHKQLL